VGGQGVQEQRNRNEFKDGLHIALSVCPSFMAVALAPSA